MFAGLSKWLQDFTKRPTLELSELAPEPEAPAAAEGKASPAPDENRIEFDRIELMQKMWGKGFSMPGTNEFYLALTRPFQLNADKSFVDLNAGLGGVTRLVAEEFKTYATGYERDTEIAAKGMEISTMGGQGKRATIIQYDPKVFEFSKKADAYLACDFFYSLEDKDKMLGKMAAAIKPGGHVVMTDFVCDPALLKDPAIITWIAKEPYGAHPVSSEEMLKLFPKYRFDLRVNEDLTQQYNRDVLMGLMRMVQWLEGKKLSHASKRLVAQTVDLWAARLRALNKGVKHVRYYAIH